MWAGDVAETHMPDKREALTACVSDGVWQAGVLEEVVLFLSTVPSSSSTASSPHVLTVANVPLQILPPAPTSRMPGQIRMVCGLLVKFLVVSLGEYTKSIAPAGAVVRFIDSFS